MISPRSFLVAALLLTGAEGNSQDAKTSPRLVEDLLTLPAPPRPWTEEKVGGGKMPPPLDAPIGVVLSYWSEKVPYWSSNREPLVRPDADTLKVLLSGCETKPVHLARLIEFFPTTPDFTGPVKTILEKGRANPDRYFDFWRKSVEAWLRKEGADSWEAVVKAARAAGIRENWMHGADDVRGLAKSWEKGEPLLREFAGGKKPRVAAVALGVLHEEAIKRKNSGEARTLRMRLKAIARDQKAPGHARDFAIQALLGTEWEGREAWYNDLFSDPTLRELPDSGHLLMPLAMPVWKDPDTWLPIVAKKVGNADRAVHDIAVSILIHFNLSDARRDALLPLLPWLSDPEWSSARDRYRLAQSLTRIEIPECRPGLLAMLTNPDGQSVNALSAGAQALEKYPDKRAIPALKVLLEIPVRQHMKEGFLRGLVACGGLSGKEIADAVEAYAEKASTKEGRKELDNAWDIIPKVKLAEEVSFGDLLRRIRPGHEEAVRLLLDRAGALHADKPAVARGIREIVLTWPAFAVDGYLAKRIRVGAATADDVRRALERRDRLAEAPPDLRKILDTLGNARGVTRGIAAVLLKSAEQATGILEGDDREAKKGLLAAARLVRQELPLEQVIPLLASEDPFLALAAERYLEMDDGPQAREAIWKKYGREIRILGARDEHVFPEAQWKAQNAWEAMLRAEMLKPDAPDNLYALFIHGSFDQEESIEIRVKDGRATQVRVNDGKARASRDVPPDAFKRFQAFIKNRKVDDLPPASMASSHAAVVEYLHLWKTGGRRVYMVNPGQGPTAGSTYHMIPAHFELLAGEEK